jgi:phage shock protein PspC (stress-responsive transcriptional regulator)
METTTTPTDTPTPSTPNAARLERPLEGRVVAGVAAGIAHRAGWSVALVRLGFLVAALFGGVGILLYLAAWALMPEAGETTSATDRWLADLGDPDRRTSAVVVGITAGIALVVLAPITSIAVVALAIGAAVLVAERRGTRSEGSPEMDEASIADTTT